MKYAVKKDNIVANIIIANVGQKEELETALNAELVDQAEYGLAVGDLWTGENWTRNIDGEQVVLSPVEPEPEPVTWDALAEAYREGVESIG